MKYNFKNVFPNTIWKRGVDYYLKGKVKQVTSNGDNFSAKVMGSKTYRVEMSIKNDRINAMDCTCPYAEEGHRCKHMAALAVYLENQPQSIDEISFFDNYQWMLKEYLTYYEKSDFINNAKRYFKTLKLAYSEKAMSECIAGYQFLEQVELDNANGFIGLVEEIENKFIKLLQSNQKERGISWAKDFFCEVTSRILFDSIINVFLIQLDKNQVKTVLPLQKNFHSLEKSQYWMSKIIIRLKELDCSTEEIISSVKAYPLFENDSLDIIAYLESNEKEQECLDFMLTQLTFFDEGDNELYFLIEKASKLAKKLKNKQAYFQIMNASITHDFDSDKLLSDFKKMFKETEWEEHKIALFDYWDKKIDLETYLRILDTYSENERLTEKLFKVDNIYILLRYLDVARNIDENMAIHLFIQLLMKKIKNKSTRYDYYRLCEEIRNLNQFSGGQDLIDECFVQLRLTFHDNKTFIEVLNEFEKEDEDKYENNY